LLPDYQNLYFKCTQWLRCDATADSSINGQLIKMHSTHLWTKCVLSSSIRYFVVCYFSVKYLIPQNFTSHGTLSN